MSSLHRHVHGNLSGCKDVNISRYEGPAQMLTASPPEVRRDMNISNRIARCSRRCSQYRGENSSDKGMAHRVAKGY